MIAMAYALDRGDPRSKKINNYKVEKVKILKKTDCFYICVNREGVESQRGIRNIFLEKDDAIREIVKDVKKRIKQYEDDVKSHKRWIKEKQDAIQKSKEYVFNIDDIF